MLLIDNAQFPLKLTILDNIVEPACRQGTKQLGPPNPPRKGGPKTKSLPYRATVYPHLFEVTILDKYHRIFLAR